MVSRCTGYSLASDDTIRTATSGCSLGGHAPNYRLTSCEGLENQDVARALQGLHLDAVMPPRYDARQMSKVRTTLTIDESVMKAVKMRAARTGRGDSQVIEESLRRDMGLDLLERLWEKNNFAERDAEALAVEAQHKTRSRRR